MILADYMRQTAGRVDAALHRILPSDPSPLSRAMRYMVFPGGKRIRPIVVLATAETLGRPRDAMIAACAVELIHTYSLIHDDLPCMDDDDVRRGRASCHKKFDEATAVLTGDALLTLAFEILPNTELVKVLADDAGHRGMVGGQVRDLKDSKLDRRVIEEIYARKTAALFAASAEMGALCAGRRRQELRRYGFNLGMLFQTIDDCMDQDPDKLTLPRLLGADGALTRAKSFATAARKSIMFLGKRGNTLVGLIDLVFSQVNQNA